MKNILILFATLILTSTSFASSSDSNTHPGQGPTDPLPPPVESEILLGFLSSESGLTFQVQSGGCTSKSDFVMFIAESYPPQLRLHRMNPDPCATYPSLIHGTTVFYSFQELGITDGIFSLENAIVPGFVNVLPSE